MLELFGIPIGTIAQVGTFALIAVALIGAYVKLRDRGMTHAEVMCGQLTAEVQKLRQELHDCEEGCRVEIKKLHEEIHSMRKQNITEQISFINILLDTVDSPALQTLRHTLERVQIGLSSAKVLQQDEGDIDV